MDLGTYIEYDGRPAVRFQRTYAHPVERVWRAVSDPAELAAWFPSQVRLEPRTGGTITFTGDPYAEDETGTVLVYDPPHRLSFTWYDDLIHLIVEPMDDGHSSLTLVDVLDEAQAAARNASGWFVCLDELAKVLEGRAGAGPHAEEAAPWEPVYEAHVRAGLPSGAEIPDAAPRT